MVNKKGGTMIINRIFLNSLTVKPHYEVYLNLGERLYVNGKIIAEDNSYTVIDSYESPYGTDRDVIFEGGKATVRFNVPCSCHLPTVTLSPAWRRHFHPVYGLSYVKKNGELVRNAFNQLPVYNGELNPSEPMYAVYTPGGFIPDSPLGYRLAWVCNKADTTWLFIRDDDPRIIE
jgi:hypothetical protein